MAMLHVLWLFTVIVADDRVKPDALIKLELGRQALHTLEIEYWRTYYLKGSNPTSGRPFLRRTIVAADQSIKIVNKGYEGRISSLFDDGQPASRTPVEELYRDRGVWSYKAGKFAPDYHGTKRLGASLPDPRTLGLVPFNNPRGRRLDTALYEIGPASDSPRYRVTVDGPIHTVTATSANGYQRVWKINADKGWNAEEVLTANDGEVQQRIVSRLTRYQQAWFPSEVTVFGKDGTVSDVIKVAAFEANEPHHPKRLTLSDIGVDRGMTVRDRTRVGGPGVGGNQVWDGEKLVPSKEWGEKLRRGEVQRGRRFASIREQLKQGTYRGPDYDLMREYDLRRGLAKGAVTEWERYVRAFIAKYELNDDQQQKALRILRDCHDKATEYTLRHKRQLARKDLDEKVRKELLAPIDEIFEKQLKPRLEKLPTRAQRRTAAERGKRADPSKPRP